MQTRRAASCLLLACLALLTSACGLTAPRSNEGYANLDSLGMLDVDNVMTLSIGPALLRLAASGVEEDPQTRAMLRGLDGVRIRIYQIDGDATRVAARAERMQHRLQLQDWQAVAVMQEPGERVYLLLKMSGERIAGMIVITAGHDEAVVVNIMGELRPEMFNDTMAALDQDAPELHLASVE